MCDRSDYLIDYLFDYVIDYIIVIVIALPKICDYKNKKHCNFN